MINITPYKLADNDAALKIENQCTQGESLILKYLRPTFHKRSEVYQKYKIFCAKDNENLVGISAWAEKYVRLHREMIRTAYFYDLRVHPEYRGKGLAKHLTEVLIDDVGQDIDCLYTLIAGENDRARGLAQRMFEMNFVIPLTYAVIPVYRDIKLTNNYFFVSATQIHQRFLDQNQHIEFIPDFDEDVMLGYVNSISINMEHTAGCSIWTNENLLAEQVISIPNLNRIQRILSMPLRFFFKLPYIPKPGDMLRSWFLFDLYAMSEEDLHKLLAMVNNLAFEHKRQFLYILLPDKHQILTYLKKSGYRLFTFPYYFLAKGRKLPKQTDEIYLDVRDL
jgi:ribosomal protein S18 acetylase RimI-like enzyme